MFPPICFREKSYNRALGSEGLCLGTGWFPEQQGHLAELWEQGVWGRITYPSPSLPLPPQLTRRAAGQVLGFPGTVSSQGKKWWLWRNRIPSRKTVN